MRARIVDRDSLALHLGHDLLDGGVERYALADQPRDGLRSTLGRGEHVGSDVRVAEGEELDVGHTLHDLDLERAVPSVDVDLVGEKARNNLRRQAAEAELSRPQRDADIVEPAIDDADRVDVVICEGRHSEPNVDLRNFDAELLQEILLGQRARSADQPGESHCGCSCDRTLEQMTPMDRSCFDADITVKATHRSFPLFILPGSC